MESNETNDTRPAPRLELNGPVPNFDAVTTHGPINFYDWKKGKWAILFSHPADFTPVCTTEFMTFANLHQQFEERKVQLIGNSIDSVYSHIAWVRNIKDNFDVEIKFPIIADLDMKVARLYGMLHEPSAATAAVRAVFIVDPNNLLRAMIYYPLNLGRNFDEILRVVDGLQTADKHGVACPANWRPGEQVIVPPPATAQAADERVADSSVEVTDWYFSKKSVKS